jgi:hypothetical protein
MSPSPFVDRESYRTGEERETVVVTPLAPVADPTQIKTAEEVKALTDDVTERQRALRRVIENVFPGLRTATFIFNDQGQPLVYVSDMSRVVMADWVTSAIVDLMSNMPDQPDNTAEAPPDTLH